MRTNARSDRSRWVVLPAQAGSLVLFEKVLASSARNQETAIGAYAD